MSKLQMQNFWQASLKVSVLSLILISLAGCQLWEMASYQWHNANAEAGWKQGKSYAALPFKMVNGHVLVMVGVNGAPMTFVLDSGAEATVITETAATNKLKLPKDNPLTISGQGNAGDPTAFVVNDVRIDAGDFSIKNMSVIYAPTDAMPFDSYEETYFDGVLGADFFNCCLVEINHDQQTLYLSKPGTEKERQYNNENWQKLAIDVQSNTPFLTTQIDNDGSIKQIKVMLDTGSNGTLSLFAGKGDFTIPEQTYVTRSTGISGDSINHLGMLTELTFGKYQFTDFPTNFRTQGSNHQSGSHGVLGNQIMQRFNLVFDFPNQAIWVQPNMNYSRPIGVDRSGLRVWPHTQGGIAKDIAPGTGADALKIGKNSIITHINHQRLTADNFDQLTELFTTKNLAQVPLCWRAQKTEHCEMLALKARL
jgi:hypothetical protein